MNPKSIDKLVAEAFAIETEDARQAGALGFMARALTIATMPHKRVEGCEFERRNGDFTLSMLAPSRVGLPYGSVPRLLMAWMTTEAVRTREREIVLGPSLSGFMAQLDLLPTGGRWGSITRLRDQMRRLFSCSIHGYWTDEAHDAGVNFSVVSRHRLWWDPKQPEQATLWKSTVTLGEEFFRELIERPVPIDLRALKALKRSPLAIDIYIWLTHRLSYLSQDAEIPWVGLQGQFGCGYAMDAHGQRNFRQAFRRELKKVLLVYRPEPPRVEDSPECLVIHPSRPHILPAKL
jgi:hypothetical protein